MTTFLGDTFNISIDEASGVQKVAESKEASAIVKTPEQDNGRTLSKSATLGRGWSIFRVPAHVREVDNRAYSPMIVSIGPFHHNQEALRAFEDQKKRFLSRLENQRNRVHLENAMKKMEAETRKCYSEDFGSMTSDDFVRMMLLDGYFIVELLRLYTKIKKNHDVEEPILETRWMVPNIGRDLLMLENQLPMFVLQKIYEITTTFDNEATDPLNKLALRFFEPLRPGKEELSDDILNNIEKQKQKHPHLLALFQSTFHNTQGNPNASAQTQSKYDEIPGKGWVHNATTLTYARVRFETKSGNFLDIAYKNRVLTIPTLHIDDGTSPLLRNLIAYEQSNRSAKPPYFSCLAVFLDSIVDTVDDINILRRANIIKQAKGGDQEVVNLFNSLTRGVEIDMDDCYMRKQIQDVNRHYERYEAMASFYRSLSKLTFVRFFTAYLSTLLTVISIWSAIKNCNCEGPASLPSSAPGRRPPPTP